jgi:hypothetical protein
MFKKEKLEEVGSSASNMGLYGIVDQLSESVGPLFEAKNDAVAIRHFKMCMKKVYDPRDYILICVGYVERNSGQAIIIPEQLIVEVEGLDFTEHQKK